MVRAIAITGGIGSGKSQLRGILERLGYVCCNADALAREILEDPEVRDQIESAFGKDSFNSNGEFDRERMRGIVFSNPDARVQLEAITHPAIAKLFGQKLQRLEKLSPGAWMFYEAAVVLEAKRQSDFDAIVLVSASEQVRLSRLRQFRGMDEALAKKIMSSQMPEEEKLKHAHYVIDNSGDPEALEKKAIELVRYLENKFSQ